jgi:hypothetical protein
MTLSPVANWSRDVASGPGRNDLPEAGPDHGLQGPRRVLKRLVGEALVILLGLVVLGLAVASP